MKYLFLEELHTYTQLLSFSSMLCGLDFSL